MIMKTPCFAISRKIIGQSRDEMKSYIVNANFSMMNASHFFT